jgi:tRNA A-37 threonylcarbamoyl transferase component Bud32
MDAGQVTFEFALFGEVLSPRAGVVALDVGSTCVAGVIDHHFGEAGADCAATLVVRRGEELVLGHLGGAPVDGPLTIVVHREPDLDSVVAAYLCLILARTGALPEGAQALAEYARLVDAGKLPPDGLGQTSLWALYTAATHLLGAAADRPADDAEIFRSWLRRGFELLDLVIEPAPRAVDEVRLPADLPGFEDEWAFLTQERSRYVADRAGAVPFEVFLPVVSGEFEQEVRGLRVRNPAAALFVPIAWAEGFPVVHVVQDRPVGPEDPTVPERHQIAVSPESGFWLRGLGAALERREEEARARLGCLRPQPPRWPDVTNADPWYDGRSPLHGYAVVDTPGHGTVLALDEVVETILDSRAWIELGRPVKELLCTRGCRFPRESGASYCPFHSDKLMPSLVDGRYEVLSLIAEGGMGSVWRVRDIRTSTPYALKRVLQRHLGDEDVWNRFRREASLSSCVDHPNVVRVVRSGMSAESGPYIVTEFVEGTDLRKDLSAFQARGEWYPWPRARNILLQVCGALETVHGAGVLHRDLKPENIRLQGGEPGGDDPSPVVKILDFGLSILADRRVARITAVGTVSGTIEYAAPEQLRGDDLDQRADLYSLGCILYEMLCFDPPFTGYDTPMDAAMAKIAGEARPLPHRHPQVNRDGRVEALLFRMISRSPAGRPRTAAEVAAELSTIT